MELLERFGTPWVIGKTEGDKNALADEIYNMLGTRVYEKIKGIEKRTEIAGFESGVYFVQIKTKTNRVLTNKLIIQ